LNGSNLPVQPHYSGIGRGLVRNLFVLVWATSQLYKGVWSLEAGLLNFWGQYTVVAYGRTILQVSWRGDGVVEEETTMVSERLSP
jgi:hypothetical protein